jgi:hypothetical protein
MFVPVRGGGIDVHVIARPDLPPGNSGTGDG